MEQKKIIDRVERYYSQKIKEHGAVPQGVDWNGEDSQKMRFDQLLKIVDQKPDHFSLLDFGCGYGALLTYINSLNLKVIYTGFDISSSMIEVAKKTQTDTHATWKFNGRELEKYDYVIASGIFNVMEQTETFEWEQYIESTLFQINNLCTKGFSFNVLTEYSDPEKIKSNLFYASPTKLFNHCKINFSKSVALLHDYPLYEFTILVRKNIL